MKYAETVNDEAKRFQIQKPQSSIDRTASILQRILAVHKHLIVYIKEWLYLFEGQRLNIRPMQVGYRRCQSS